MDFINFKNLPSTETPVNATNLNQMQSNVENAINNDKILLLSDTIGWKRIAMLYDTAFTNLTITNNPAYGTVLNLTASVLRGYQPIIIRNVYRMSNDRLFTKARIVHKFNEQRAYLELYQNLEQAKPLYIKASNNSKGLTFMEAETEGSIPDGYEVYEIDLFVNDIPLENMLHFIPQFTNLIGDNSTLNVNINSSLEGFYLFINSHINLREVYIITFYSNIGLKVDTIYRNSDAQGSTTFSISGNTLIINGAINCRGQLYYVPQMLANN